MNSVSNTIARDSFEYLWSGDGREVNTYLNTYRNWNEYGLQVEPVFDTEDGNDSKLWWDLGSSNKKNFIGTKAIFNNVNSVFKGDWDNPLKMAMNAPLLDSQQVRDKIRERGGCSIKELVEASEKGLMGRAIYDYSDFMFCKHLGKMSNNYLITLRRFPFPAGDHISYTLWPGDGPDSDEYTSNHHAPDIGRLVTWMGTPDNKLEDILKYKVLMPYKEMESQIQDAEGTAEDGGLLGSVMNMANKDYVAGTLRGSCGTSSTSTLGKMLGGTRAVAGPNRTDWAYYRDQSKPYGPVDVIAKTHIRKDGSEGGLLFEQSISLTFDYELRSYDGINGRAALLDLLGNILSVTYTNGNFWGGQIRSTGMAQSNIFANLPIFNLNGHEDYNQIKDKFMDSLSDVGKAMNNGQPIGGISDVISMIKNMASNIGKVLLGGVMNALGRPVKQGLNSLLSSDPVGLWHLTIGNPKHPIMSMGNMILTDVEIQHYGPLGLDDFPTGLKVKVTLTHGMPRDKMRIEHMYGLGDNRIYFPAGKNIELMYDNATPIKSRDTANASNTDRITANTNTQTVDESSKAVVDAIDLSKSYTKYFGMSDIKVIDKASREGHLGSSKARTKEESDKIKKEASSKMDNQQNQ